MTFVPRKLGIALALALPTFVAVAWSNFAWASPVTLTDVLVIQDAGFSQVSLISQPGAVVGPTSPYSSAVTFAVAMNGTGAALLDLTWTLGSLSQHVVRPLSITGPTQDWESFDPGVIYAPGMDGVFTVTLNGLTSAYDFHYVYPAPEPATWMLLLSGGLAGLVTWRRHRRLG